MNIDSYIDKLSDDLKPFKPFLDLRQHWIAIGLVLVAYAVIGVVWEEPRPDFSSFLGDPWNVSELALLLVMLVFAVRAVVLYAVPDTYQQNAYPYIPRLAATALLVSLVLAAVVKQQVMAEPVEIGDCLVPVVLIGLAPGALGLLFFRHKLFANGAQMGEMLMWAGLSLSAIVLCCACNIASLSHVLLAHYAPIVGCAVLGRVVGRFWFLRSARNPLAV